MTRSGIFHWPAVIVAVWSMIIPPHVPATESPLPVARAPVAVDVTLDARGSLCGQVTNESGQAQAGTKVLLQQGTRVVAVATTEDSGQFILPGVRPGLYSLSTARGSVPVRVWSYGTAPPISRAAALLVDGQTVVLGQSWSPMRRALILGGVIITSGVIGGVIGYNIDDDAS